MKNTNILISGASIAGPTLAYWLKQYGFTPTVIERSPLLREGGFPVDVRDAAVDIAKRMGIWSRLRQEKTTLRKMSFVNEHNRRISGINVYALRKALNLDRSWAEVMRGSLAKTVYEITNDEVEYIFGNSIQTLEQDDEGVDVTFESGNTRRFDLVVGADGLHSIVRTLAFGDEAIFERYCGYQVGVFTTDNYLELDNATMRVYSVPGKQTVVRSSPRKEEMVACFIFKQPTKLRYDRHDVEQQKRLLSEAFAGEAWEIPGLLEKMHTASDLYFDAVSQIRMETWFRGRVILLGDAAHCPALLTGQGSTLAMMGAYILAGELKAALGDHQRAFQEYERAFKPFVTFEQNKIESGTHVLVPETRFSIWVQNHLSSPLSPFFLVPGGPLKGFFPKSNVLKDYGHSLMSS